MTEIRIQRQLQGQQHLPLPPAALREAPAWDLQDFPVLAICPGTDTARECRVGLRPVLGVGLVLTQQFRTTLGTETGLGTQVWPEVCYLTELLAQDLGDHLLPHST